MHFLDDDDQWVKDKLSVQLKKMDESSSAIACSCDYSYHYKFGLVEEFRLPPNVTLNQLYYKNVLGGASMCLCLRDALVEIEGFDEKLKSGQDWDLWVRLLSKGDVVVCNIPLVRYFAHAGLRISTNMHSQYTGLRYFYFKHRHNMDWSIRRFRIVTYASSNQKTRRKV